MNGARGGIAVVALVAGLSACASVLGFDDLHATDDAASSPGDDATRLGADATVGVEAASSLDGGMTEADASVGTHVGTDADTPEDFVPPPDAFPCPAAQLIGVDTTNATHVVPASGVDVYTFVLAQAASVLVRVRTGASTADITVGTSCDGTGAVLPPSHVAMNGAFARGHVAAGAYYVTITWDAAMVPGSPYTFDLLRDSPAANAACATPTPLTTEVALTGRTFDANDLSPGCRGATPYGELFYAVTVPANAAWEVTATPLRSSWSPWTIALQAPSACDGTTCALPAALSETPGAAATLTLENPSMTAPKTFVLGVSESADDAVTGGGSFTLAAKVLASCIGENMPCMGGICCAGHCEPPATQNGCGHTCETSCPVGGAVCTSSACACPSASPTQCPTAGLPACTNTLTDRANCSATGACGNVCTTSDPHALPDVLCKAGVCTTTCQAGFTHCSKLCTDLQRDPKHCGTCSGTGAVCPAAEVCQGGHCACPTAANPDFCGSACTNVHGTDRNNCGVCGHACAAAETCQNGRCACPTLAKPDFCNGLCTTFQTDRNNCGVCGNRCPAAEVCSAGSCSCPDPTKSTFCSPSCTDTQTDNSNCGVCGVVCAGGQSCVAGKCVCPRTLPTLCSGVCTNTQSDSNHCGTCPHVCPLGETCQTAMCGCWVPGSPDLCAGICTNKQNDPNNCGTCTVMCPAPQVCSSGTCSCPASSPFACGATCCGPTADGGMPSCDAGVCSF